MFWRRRNRLKGAGDGREDLNFGKVPDFLIAHEKWVHFVTRIGLYCGDLPERDGDRSLMERAVGSGCAAMAVVDKSSRWERLLDPVTDEREEHCKSRVRLGAFFAGCLEYLLPLLCSIEVEVQGARWVVGEESFTGYWKRQWEFTKYRRVKGKGPELNVNWNYRVVRDSELLVLAAYFFTYEEIRHVGADVAEAVFDFVAPGKYGLFDWIIRDGDGASVELTEGGALNGIRAEEAS